MDHLSFSITPLDGIISATSSPIFDDLLLLKVYVLYVSVVRKTYQNECMENGQGLFYCV